MILLMSWGEWLRYYYYGASGSRTPGRRMTKAEFWLRFTFRYGYSPNQLGT